jgi:hypothetical protein
MNCLLTHETELSAVCLRNIENYNSTQVNQRSSGLIYLLWSNFSCSGGILALSPTMEKLNRLNMIIQGDLQMILMRIQ